MSRQRMRLAVLAMISGSAVMMAAPAYAICDEPRTVYEFSKGTPSSLLTNVRSGWGDGPGSVTLSRSATATVSASATATVSTEMGLIIAKASASLGVTVGKSWAHTDTFTYARQVPAGKQGRIVVYHESRAFTVTKKGLRSPCKYVTIYSRQTVNAPLKGGSDIYRLQLRKPIPGKASQNDDHYDTEIDLAVVPSGEGVITN